MGSLRRPATALSVLLVLGVAAGCELVTKRDGLQCQTTSDCRAKGAAFDATICSSAGICEEVSAPAASLQACTSSAQCNYVLDASAGRCINYSCVPIPSSCSTIGPFDDDSAVVLGVLLPQGGTAASEVAKIPNILGDNLDSWNANGSTGTKFVALVCDESNLTASLAALSSLQVKILVGPTSEAALQTVLGSSQFFVVSPLGDDRLYTQAPDPHQAQWFIDSNRAYATQAFADLINSVASSVATSRKKSKIKLTLVQDSLEPDEADFFKDLTALPLTFNGQAADTGGGYYATADVMTNVVDSSSGSPGEQALGVATFQPDVVVLTGPLWASSFVAGLETRWTVLNHGVPPPVYVMMRELPSLATYAKLQGWADGRMYALDVSRDATVQANYGTVLGTLEGVGVTQETAEPYGLTEFNDALFAAMYAVVVSGGIQQTSVLAPAMLTLSQGANMVSLVLPSVPQMLGLIGQKVTTEMVGATDYLGFDSSTAVPSPATGAYCLGSHASSSPYAWTPAGVTYDAKTGSPTGTLACP